jgi:hypothetical protein
MKTILHNLSLLIVFSLLIIIQTLAFNLEFRVKIFEKKSAISVIKLDAFAPIRMDDFSSEVGSYSEFLLAKKAQNELEELGYASTEVVTYFNNVPISLEDAFALMDNRNEQDEYATVTPISEKEMEIALERVKNTDFYYTIFVTVKTDEDVDRFFELPELYQEFVSENGVNRYAYGKFTSYQNVNDLLKMVKEMGFEEAEIISFDSLERIPLNVAIEKERNLLEQTLAEMK